MSVIKTTRGQILLTEGFKNDHVYIIRQGNFVATKRQKTDIPDLPEQERVREFL